jgi:hypothetical protein
MPDKPDKQEFTLQATLREMVGSEDVQVQTSPNVELDKLIEGDDNPQFGIFDVLYEGESENWRDYTRQAVEQCVEQLPGLPAYAGHDNVFGAGWEFKFQHAVWIGAKLVEEAGKVTARAKCYFLKSAVQMREIAAKSLLTKKPIGASINGGGVFQWDSSERGKPPKVVELTLESADFTNPGKQGMKKANLLAVVTEMAGNRPAEGERIMDLKELKEKHPDLYAQAVAEGKAQGKTEAEAQLQEQQKLENLRQAKLTELKLPDNLQEQGRLLLKVATTEQAITAQAEALRAMVTELAKPPTPAGNPPQTPPSGDKFFE